MPKEQIVTQGNSSLNGTLFIPTHSNSKAVLFIHGWKSNELGYADRATALAELGYTCLTFNLRGHGDSNGDLHNLTHQDFVNDVIEAYDFLSKQKEVNPNMIGVVGASFGGYLAALLTKERSVRWLVLRAPANYPDKGFRDVAHYRYTDSLDWRKQPLDFHKTKALSALHEYPHEILIIESEKDERIPHQTIQNYVDVVSDKSQLTYKIMKGADHGIKAEKDQKEFITILTEWFKKKV